MKRILLFGFACIALAASVLGQPGPWPATPWIKTNFDKSVSAADAIARLGLGTSTTNVDVGVIQLYQKASGDVIYYRTPSDSDTVRGALLEQVFASAATNDTIVIGPGKFELVTNFCQIKAGQTVLLHGATIKNKDDDTDIFRAYTYTNLVPGVVTNRVPADNWTLGGSGTLIGRTTVGPWNGSVNKGAGIRVTDLARNWKVEGLNFENFNGAAINLNFVNYNSDGNGRFGGGRISRVRCHNNLIGLYTWPSAEYAKIVDSEFLYNVTGLALYAGNPIITSCNICANSTGIYLGGDIGSNSDHGVATGLEINHNTAYSVYARSNSFGMEFFNCNVFPSDTSNWADCVDHGSSIVFEAGTGVTFDGGQWGVNTAVVLSNTIDGYHMIRGVYFQGTNVYVRGTDAQKRHLIIEDCYTPTNLVTSIDNVRNYFTLPNLASLCAYTGLSTNMTILGHTTANDGGGGVFAYSATLPSGIQTNVVTCFAHASGTGYWIRQLPGNDTVYLEMAGGFTNTVVQGSGYNYPWHQMFATLTNDLRVHRISCAQRASSNVYYYTGGINLHYQYLSNWMTIDMGDAWMKNLGPGTTNTSNSLIELIACNGAGAAYGPSNPPWIQFNIDSLNVDSEFGTNTDGTISFFLQNEAQGLRGHSHMAVHITGYPQLTTGATPGINTNNGVYGVIKSLRTVGCPALMCAWPSRFEIDRLNVTRCWAVGLGGYSLYTSEDNWLNTTNCAPVGYTNNYYLHVRDYRAHDVICAFDASAAVKDLPNQRMGTLAIDNLHVTGMSAAGKIHGNWNTQFGTISGKLQWFPASITRQMWTSDALGGGDFYDLDEPKYNNGAPWLGFFTVYNKYAGDPVIGTMLLENCYRGVNISLFTGNVNIGTLACDYVYKPFETGTSNYVAVASGSFNGCRDFTGARRLMNATIKNAAHNYWARLFGGGSGSGGYSDTALYLNATPMAIPTLVTGANNEWKNVTVKDLGPLNCLRWGLTATRSNAVNTVWVTTPLNHDLVTGDRVNLYNFGILSDTNVAVTVYSATNFYFTANWASDALDHVNYAPSPNYGYVAPLFNTYSRDTTSGGAYTCGFTNSVADPFTGSNLVVLTMTPAHSLIAGVHNISTKSFTMSGVNATNVTPTIIGASILSYYATPRIYKDTITIAASGYERTLVCYSGGGVAIGDYVSLKCSNVLYTDNNLYVSNVVYSGSVYLGYTITLLSSSSMPVTAPTYEPSLQWTIVKRASYSPDTTGQYVTWWSPQDTSRGKLDFSTEYLLRLSSGWLTLRNCRYDGDNSANETNWTHLVSVAAGATVYNQDSYTAAAFPTLNHGYETTTGDWAKRESASAKYVDTYANGTAIATNSVTVGSTDYRMRIDTGGSNPTAGGLYIGTNGTAQVVVTNGNVGIGTASPGYGFHVKLPQVGGAPTMMFEDSAANTAYFGFRSTGSSWYLVPTVSWFGLYSVADAATRLIVEKTTGNMGINTNATSAKLHVEGSSSTSPVFSAWDMATSATTPLLTVLTNGNVGIGTATPSNLLTEKSTTALESAPLGSELLASGDTWTLGAGWSGDFVSGFTHAAGGGTGAVTDTTVVPTATYLYQVAFTITGRTAGSIALGFGSETSSAYTSTSAWGVKATGTGTLAITPSTSFDGTVIISIKRITGSYSATYAIQDSAAVNSFEIRNPLSSLNNTFVGVGAGGWNTTGRYNSADGVSALDRNTTGSYNTAEGVSALGSNTTGSNNTAEGVNALYSNTTGSNNSAEGLSALYYNTTGSYNTADGVGALSSNTTGSYNTAHGMNAGCYLADGVTGNTNSASSVFIGYDTRAAVNNGQNEIVIGASTIGAGSNSVTLGNTAIATTILRGAVGITNAASQQLTLAYSPTVYTKAGTDSGGNFSVAPGGTVKATMDSSGKLRVGDATAPSITLHVGGSSSGDIELARLENTSGTLNSSASLGFAAGAVIRASISGISKSIADNSGALMFNTRGATTMAERMRIDSAGNVGIGTTAPSGPIDVANRFTVMSGALNWTSGTAYTVAHLTVPAGACTGGSLNYTILCSNGGTNLSASGTLLYTANALGTAVLAGLTDTQNPAVPNPALAGTLTWAWSANVATNNVLALQLTATHNLVDVVSKTNCYYTLNNNATNSVVTCH